MFGLSSMCARCAFQEKEAHAALEHQSGLSERERHRAAGAVHHNLRKLSNERAKKSLDRTFDLLARNPLLRTVLDVD